MSTKNDLPQRVRLLIGLVTLAAAASVAVAMPAALHWSHRDLLAWLGLAAAGAAVEQFLLPLWHRSERQFFSLTDALWMAGLLLARPSVLILAVGAAILVGQTIRRVAPYKVMFNVGQYILAVTAAEAVFTLLHPMPHTGPMAWLAGTVAMLAYFAVNTGAVALVISMVVQKPFLSIMARPFTLTALQWAGNMGIGILGVELWQRNRVGLPLLAVPVIVSYLAYQGWLKGLQERDRARGLYEAGQELVKPLKSADDLGPFLRAVEQMLNADAAELVLVDGDEVSIHDSVGKVALRAEVAGEAGSRGPEAYVRVRLGMTPHVAPIAGGGETHGVLAVYREQPLSESERSLVDALSSQIAVRLQNVRLFFETIEQRTQLEQIIGHTSDGIFVVSPTWTIRSWNPAMQRVTGFSAEEAVGREWEEILGTVAPEGLPSRQVDDSLDPQAPGREVQIVRKDRVTRWIGYTWNPILDREGQVEAYVVVARDITAELQAQRLKDDFVATVSHELRTPLTPLKGFVMALLQGTVEDSPESRREYYEIMLKQANRLERLITDLLEVSRIEADAPLVKSEVVELTALVTEKVQEFAEQEQNREFRTVTHGTVRPVLGDPFRIDQVLSNLLSNATKYSPAGSAIDIVVRGEADHATVSVVDVGEGIPTEEHDRVFERFHRVENGLTRTTGGAGLGLYIARRLIGAMSGRLWVESQPGFGSTFSFSLPVANGEAQAEPANGRKLGPATRPVGSFGAT
jgi:PAS domain S-box-containing protein